MSTIAKVFTELRKAKLIKLSIFVAFGHKITLPSLSEDQLKGRIKLLRWLPGHQHTVWYGVNPPQTDGPGYYCFSQYINCQIKYDIVVFIT